MSYLDHISLFFFQIHQETNVKKEGLAALMYSSKRPMNTMYQIHWLLNSNASKQMNTLDIYKGVNIFSKPALPVHELKTMF